MYQEFYLPGEFTNHENYDLRCRYMILNVIRSTSWYPFRFAPSKMELKVQENVLSLSRLCQNVVVLNPVVFRKRRGRRDEETKKGISSCTAFLSFPSARKNNRNCSGLAPAPVLLGIVSNWVEPITYVARKLMPL